MSTLRTNLNMLLKGWLLRDEGQDMVEYALLLGLIAMGAVAGIAEFAGAFAGDWNFIIEHLAPYLRG